MEEKGEIASKVSKLLGYNMLGFTRNVKELGMALKELGIQPFDPSSVNKYKQTMLKTKHRTKVKWQRLGVGALALAVFLPLAWYRLALRPSSWFESLVWLLAVASMVAAGVFLVHSSDFRATNAWERTTLSSYSGNVPEFALMRAVEIKERVPAAYFNVEYLTHTESYIPFTVDPFLIVILGNESYYIDVWDEPQFERKL